MVVVHGHESFEVLGDGAAYVVDGRDITYSNLTDASKGDVLSVDDVRLHVLAAGSSFDLTTRRPTRTREEVEWVTAATG